MDFFRSVFSDEPRYPRETEEEEGAAAGNANPGEVAEGEGESGSPSNPNRSSPITEEPASAAAGFGGWNFGSLIKTITTRSEQVIETYRHGLDEFRVGLAEEARVVAATLPVSLETGASVAQESLESVGQAIDVVFKSTADLISHGKDALLSLDNPNQAVPAPSSIGIKKFTRFEMQLHAIQNDANTYCEDPDDVDDFTKWKSGFSLQEMEDEIEELCEENAAVSGFFAKLVPKTVDSDTFWTRYAYRVHKLKQVEEARAHLVKRVMAGDEEEDLSWEVDDDDDESETAEPNESQNNAIKDIKGLEEVHAGSSYENVESPKKEGTASEEVHEKEPCSESSVNSKDLEAPSESTVNENAKLGGETPEDKSVQSDPVKEIAEDRTLLEEKTDNGESSKDSDFSVVSSQVSAQEEDDLGWDEIEDLGSNDETKATTSGGSPNKVDIRKRLSTADDEEDLNWDIEDDDDVKS
ncbi:BSD domain-containing protein 1 [Nymphaea thermarum]|nr:BSD domain-containing protein 1 [Nymphaea thermarum]